MAGTLTFKVSEVLPLVAHSKASQLSSPCMEELFNPEYHQGGKIKQDANGFPDQDNLDRSKIPKGLWLVKDRGVYLMPNSSIPLLVKEGEVSRVVAYAAESDPTGNDHDYWEAGQKIMGGDDCVINLPLSMFEPVLALLSDGDVLKLKVTSKQIRVLMPKVRR
jgi:hypothetical protein